MMFFLDSGGKNNMVIDCYCIVIIFGIGVG